MNLLTSEVRYHIPLYTSPSSPPNCDPLGRGQQIHSHELKNENKEGACESSYSLSLCFSPLASWTSLSCIDDTSSLSPSDLHPTSVHSDDFLNMSFENSKIIRTYLSRGESRVPPSSSNCGIITQISSSFSPVPTLPLGRFVSQSILLTVSLFMWHEYNQDDHDHSYI
jgi:hypothetical protein